MTRKTLNVFKMGMKNLNKKLNLKNSSYKY